jgi:hypothetical protein
MFLVKIAWNIILVVIARTRSSESRWQNFLCADTRRRRERLWFTSTKSFSFNQTLCWCGVKIWEKMLEIKKGNTQVCRENVGKWKIKNVVGWVRSIVGISRAIKSALQANGLNNQSENRVQPLAVHVLNACLFFEGGFLLLPYTHKSFSLKTSFPITHTHTHTPFFPSFCLLQRSYYVFSRAW